MKTSKGLRAVISACIAITAYLMAFSTSIHSASGACTLEPSRSTNNVGQVRAVTATVTTNGVPAAGVFVSFIIISGPNAGLNGASSTAANGETTFSYTGSGAGTNILQASGSVNNSAFTCLSTQIWRVAAAPPTITCPGNIVTNAAVDGCSQSVAFTVVASGSPMPTIRCRVGNDAISSPHSFAAGTTTVTCVASNANGTSPCSFTVTVTESEPPAITCPSDVVAGAVPGETSAVVSYALPDVSDNCGQPTVVCDPPSDSNFPLGATTVNCKATDSAGNTNACSFTVFVEEVQPEAHDLAVVKIKAPRVVNLTGRLPIQTKRVVVTIQNRSPHIETIFDLNTLVTLTVESLDSNLCSDIVPVILERRPQRRLPLNLRPRQKLSVYFDVTFDCAINPAKGLGQEDFRYTATVHHEALEGGVPDTHPECDVCPRPPLEGFFDPNPNGRIRDKGCGAPVGDGTFGNDVLTDVVYR
jgi:hypothetical protein